MSSHTNVNKVILVGNLGANPILRQSANGHPVANFSLATNRSYKLADGTPKETTVWHRVVVWGKRAEVCHKYLEKGNRVYLEGSLQSSTWKDKEGQERFKMEVLCEDIKFLSSRPFGSPEVTEPDSENLPADDFPEPTNMIQ